MYQSPTSLNIALTIALIIAAFVLMSGKSVAQTLQGNAEEDITSLRIDRASIAAPIQAGVVESTGEGATPMMPNTEIVDTNAFAGNPPSNGLTHPQAQAFMPSQSNQGNPSPPLTDSIRQSQFVVNIKQAVDPINHGQHIVGVIGCEVSMFRGTFMQVFPPSNLNRWGIHPGDRVLGYNHHRFISGWDMVREGCMGSPGSIFEITILHDGQVMSLPVPRIDSRLVVQYDRLIGSHHYEDCAAQTRSW